jgi:ferredoxin
METRVANWAFGVHTSYLSELYGLWPGRATTQILLLLLVWSHGCIGLHYWLRIAAGYRKIAPVLLALAIGVPVLAIGGFVAAGRQTAEIMREPEALARLTEQARWPDAAQIQTLIDLENRLVWGFAALLAIVAAVYGFRKVRAVARRPQRRRPAAAEAPALVSFHDGPTVAAEPDMTLLEICRSHGIAQASLCGGRARCGTCRVRIEHGIETLPPPGRAESATLRSVEATGPVRLACQIRPTASLTVEILVRSEPPAFDPVEFFELKDLVAAHVRAIESAALVDVAAGDTERLAAWPDGRLDTLMSAAPGSRFKFLGVRADYLRDRPASALAYQRSEHIVSLFVLPARQHDAVAISGARSGYNVRGWSDGRNMFYAVSDLGRGELEKLEEWLQERSTGRSDGVVMEASL